MKEYTLSFNIKENTCKLNSGEKTSIELSYNEGELEISLYYTFREIPLKMHAKANIGDNVQLVITPAHNFIIVNGVLADEEWPCGEIAMNGLHSDDMEFDISESAPEFTLPMRKGLTAEELRLPGVNIGDCMPYSATDYDGRYHLFWLYDRHHHKSKWGFGAHQWAHASTADLIHWDEHPMAVSITDPIEGSICTGSVIKDGNKFYAWYAIRMSDGSPARLTSAISVNGDDFVKSDRYFVLPERYHRTSARDPKVVLYEGRFHMIVTTSLLESGQGCLAHLVSDHADFSEFEDLGPIYVAKGTHQPECPDYFELGGYYYICFSQYYAFSKNPFGEGGWTVPEDNHIDCGLVPKTAICPWNGDRIFAGFISDGGYAGKLILKKVTNREDGKLVLHELA